MEYAIEIYDLCKNINGQEILKNVTMKIEKGKIYGFLGANGAGKTTLIKVIFHLIKADSGTIKILGEETLDTNNSTFKNIGSIIEMPVFYENLNAIENLEMHCNYMGVGSKSDIQYVLQTVELENASDKKVENFSLGMKQRLAIARAILTKPQILILDEPLNGLDPKGIADIRELLVKINKQNHTTIFLSSHILSEMEKIADTIGIINNGKMLEEISIKEIQSKNINLEDYYLNLLKGEN